MTALLVRPAVQGRVHRVLFDSPSELHLFHPKTVVTSNRQFAAFRLPRCLAGCPLHLRFLFESLLQILGLLALSNDVTDKKIHAVFALETVSLNALETLGIRLVSKLPFFVRTQHHYIILLWKDN